MKQCYYCNETKSLLDFCANKRSRGGRSNLCKACAAAKMREHRKRNPESNRLACAKYYQQNREKVIKKVRENYYRNSDRRKQSQKRYRQENAEALKKKKSEWQRKHYRENKELYLERGRELLRRKPEIAVAKKARRRARIAGSGGSFTAQEWIDLKEKYDHRCLRCGKQEPEVKITVDHVVSLVDGGSSDISNIQPLCDSCNKSKREQSIDYRHFPRCQLGMMAP